MCEVKYSENNVGSLLVNIVSLKEYPKGNTKNLTITYQVNEKHMLINNIAYIINNI